MTRGLLPSNNKPASRTAPRGFSLFEFAMAATVVALLACALLGRLLSYREQAERAAVQQTLATLRSALQLQAAKRFVAAQAGGQEALIHANPMDWLAQKPVNYLGEYYAPDVTKLPHGNWFFDRNSQTLVYLLENSESFAPDTSILLKYKVRLLNFENSPDKSPRTTQLAQNVSLDQVFDRAAVTGEAGR